MMRPKTGVDWDGIAACETGGNWSMQGSTFSGGVGFANSTWSGFGGRQFAANAGQATREQQIVVAERVYAALRPLGLGLQGLRLVPPAPDRHRRPIASARKRSDRPFR